MLTKRRRRSPLVPSHHGGDELEMDPRAWPSFIQRLKDHVGDDAGPERLREAIGQVEEPPNLGTALFGSITWPKNLGRPDGPDAALGFTIASISQIPAFQTAQGIVYAPWIEHVAAGR
jgi:hypothetical protein